MKSSRCNFMVFAMAATLGALLPAAFGGNVSFSYDALDRLAQAAFADGTVVAYAYDAAGNRLSQTVTWAAPAVTTSPQTHAGVSGNATTFTVAATGSGPLTYQWQLSTDGGGTWVDLGNTGTYSGVGTATLTVSGLTAAMNGHQFRAVVGNGSSTVSTSAAATLSVNPPGAAPAIAVHPTGQTVNAGDNVLFTVLATGTAPLSYRWRKGGVAVNGATNTSFTVTNAQPADSGNYDVVVSNGVSPDATSDVAALNVVPVGVTANHAITSYAIDSSGRTATIANQFTYAGPATNLQWSVLLPAGWSLASSDATAADAQPAAGTTGLLEWQWATLPPSPVTFNYSLNIPAVDDAPHTLSALVGFNFEGTAIQITAKVDPLTISPYHSADTNHDGKLGLTELLRVIELYNTRNGTVRTGAYDVATNGTEDGFAGDPARGNTQAVMLSRHHSADTGDGTMVGTPDGKIELIELLRVIELYNYRNGTVRTGEYRAQVGTEDGFAPGPIPAAGA